MAWSTKGFRSLPLSILHSFYEQRVSMAFLKIQIVSILIKTIVIMETFLKLNVFSSFVPIPLSNLLHAISEGFKIQVVPFGLHLCFCAHGCCFLVLSFCFHLSLELGGCFSFYLICQGYLLGWWVERRKIHHGCLYMP